MCKCGTQLELGSLFNVLSQVFFPKVESNQETVDQCVQELFSQGCIPVLFRKHFVLIM